MLCRHPAAAGTTAGRQSFSSLPGLHARTQHRHRSAAAAAARANAAQQNDLGSGLQRVVRKVQAALPIVGLFSRLTAAGGGGDGTDDLSYPEYCRALIDAAPAGFNAAVADFGQLYGKEGSRRNVLFCLWMANFAPGIIAPRNCVLAARRLRVTFDIEIEMDRFQGLREEALKNYDLVARPQGSVQNKVDLAVDSLCTIGPGLKDGQPLEGERQTANLADIVAGAFRDADGVRGFVTQSVADRPSRAMLYAL